MNSACRAVQTIAALLIVLSSNSFADRRNYVWTYQYQTMPVGATELEFYQTTQIPEEGHHLWEYRIEVEQGLSHRWDFSVYQIFSQPENGSLAWDAVQFRTRYRIGEEGQYLLDPLLYLEYRRKIDSSDPNKLECKVVLAKTVDRFNLALNPVYEYFFAPGTLHEIGLDMALSWEFAPALSLGAESVTRTEFEEEKTMTQSYLGPALSFAKGEWWYSIGAATGLTEDSDQYRVRFLMGVGL